MNWFSRPYYFNTEPRYKIVLSVGFGIFIFGFLYIFRPFGIYKLEQVFFYLSGFGLITIGILLIMLFVLPLIFYRFFDAEKWTTGKHFLFSLVSILCISIANWYYNSLGQEYFKLDRTIHLDTFLFYTFCVGSFPFLLYLFIDEKIVRGKKEKIAEKIIKKENHNLENSVLNKVCVFSSDSKKESDITINVDEIVYISSQGNYASFFLKKTAGLEEVVVRTTLSSIEEKLKEYLTMIRCHKSYIINSKYMYAVKGNARGYVLKSKELDFTIPVSRSFPKENLSLLIN